MSNIALVLGGGSGSRMRQEIPKQFLTINDCPVIIYTLAAFQNHPEIDAIAVVCLEGWENVLKAYAKQFGITKLKY
ncbi:MAG: 2-C-methyl-D-erythritol 4-phosphate cytidylyltransferase, partial [Selenomonadaceae bacterium]|nr:2-C-methyl-D-erythritol 4-phosphate cytidylyltransferase [Selenomonadaceae bacterium]